MTEPTITPELVAKYHLPTKLDHACGPLLGSTKQNPNSEQRPAPQPEGLSEGSRGLRSNATIPPVSKETETTLKGSQRLAGLSRGFLHPCRVRDFAERFPGVSLRSTPGYFLTSLRDAWESGSGAGEWIFENTFAALKNKAVAASA